MTNVKRQKRKKKTNRKKKTERRSGGGRGRRGSVPELSAVPARCETAEAPLPPAAPHPGPAGMPESGARAGGGRGGGRQRAAAAI